MASKVTITSMRTRGVMGSLKAFFTINLGPLVLEDLRLLDGPNGLFVGMPSRKYKKKDGTTGYFDIIRFERDNEGNLTDRSSRLRNDILNAAVAEYDRRSQSSGVGVSSSTDDDDDLPF